jgi:hypothetical protein
MIRHEDIKKLKKDPRGFAILMDDEDIERVITEFVEVKSLRNGHRDHYKAR